MVTMDNLYRFALRSFALGIFLVFLVAGCGGGGSSDGDGNQPPADMPPADMPPALPPDTPPPSSSESLVFRIADTGELEGRSYFGKVYSGTYTASDGVSIDVWVSLREPGTRIGTVSRLGVVIQGGTGAPVDTLLGDDGGAHTLWVAINYRGSNLADINNPQWECAPGAEFISCLRAHATFSKINPRLNAHDANSIIRLFADDGEITVDGVTMKASDFVPGGTVRTPVNLYTGSFGGVVVSYMLAEENRPELHNVFFEQVTVPNERPISDGLNNAARMMDILFSACESDPSCIRAYPDIRVNFRNFMNDHHSDPIRIDGEMVYSGGVFDRIVDLVEEREVGRAIRYTGEIANAHAQGDLVITTVYGPRGYRSRSGEHPRATYGLPNLDGDEARWADLLRDDDGSFPGITNRTGMICSFGMNRAEDPDSLSHYDKVKDEELPGDSGGTKEAFGYGFLVSYKTYLSVCPQLVQETGRLELPVVSGVEAQNVIVYRGGLDIKHYFSQDPQQDEIMAYFQDSPGHRLVITHRFLGQQVGEDSGCLQTVLGNFWNAGDTTEQSLGDNCEESNNLSASELSGW